MTIYKIFYKDKYHTIKSVSFEADYEFEAIKFGRAMFSDDFISTEEAITESTKDIPKAADKKVYSGYDDEFID